MLTLNDGRSELWQWDTGRQLTVDADCSQVHFSNKVFGRSIDVDVVDGTAIIPDTLLQTDKDLTVWAFVGTAENGYTKISKTFKVNRRNKPADYVFTPTDQTTLDDILDRIEDLEKRPSGGNGGITKEVDPTVPDWAKQPQKPTYTAADVGAIPVPETAKVGQTIVFEEVDEDGKPVKWECADVTKGGSYVLLNDIVLTEAVSNVEVTKADDGTPYNLRAIYLEVGFAEVETEYRAITYTDNNVSATVLNVVQLNRTAHFKVSERYGMNQAECWWSATSGAVRSEYKTDIPTKANTTPFQNITGIKLSTSQLVKFKIKVWGVIA